MKISKEQADYRRAVDQEMSCDNCTHFFVTNGIGQCDIVKGLIDPNFTSRFFDPDPSTEPYIGSGSNQESFVDNEIIR
jgi:outer membrane protein W